MINRLPREIIEEESASDYILFNFFKKIKRKTNFFLSRKFKNSEDNQTGDGKFTKKSKQTYADYDLNADLLQDSSHKYDQNIPLFEKLNAVTAGSDTGFFFYDLQGKNSYYSDNLRDYFYGLKSKPDYKAILQHVIFEEDRKILSRAVKKLIRNKEMQFLEVRLKAATEKLVWMKIEMKIFNNYVVVISHDVEAQKSKELILYEINQELEAFLYKSSHNLKGPAASISGLVSIALNEVKDENSLNYLKMIHESTQRLNLILNDLLNINKIKLGQLELNRIDFEGIINEVIDSVKFVDGIDQVNFILNLDHRNIYVSDKAFIYSIFQNLIENAIKYRDNRVDSYLKIQSKDKHNGIEIIFEDNGQGIPENAIAKIFNMFYRANETQKGSGLGLYIVQNALHKLKGTINIKSKLGKGTVFTLFLPLN